MSLSLKFFAGFSIAFLMFFIAAPAYAVDWLPLVPCGLNQNPEGATQDYTHLCTQCDLFHLLRNLIFAIQFGFVPVGGALLFLWAGFLYMLGGANPGYVGRAKEIFTNTVYAIIVISLAWVITNTILQNLAPDQAASWFQFSCTAEIPAPSQTPLPTTSGGPTPTPSGGPTPSTGGVPGQAQAQALIAAGVSFSTQGDCGSAYTAQTTIQSIARGQFPPVCNVSCQCVPGGASGNITVNPAILDGLLALKQSGVNFMVTSFTTGVHAGGSSHYTGHAVDLAPMGDRSVWIQTRAFLNSRGGRAICEDTRTSQDVADCNAGQVNHIHWTN